MVRPNSSYAEKMLKPFQVMKVMYTVIVLMNLFLPIISPNVMGIHIPLQWVIILVHLWGLLNGLCYFAQAVPAVLVFSVRIGEIAFYTYFKSFNWLIMGFLLILDIAFLLYLYHRKSKAYPKRVPNSELEDDEMEEF